MPPVKRTYALPSETVEHFEHVVAPGKRSAVLAQVISEWLEERKRAQLRTEIDEGCREMWDVYVQTEQELHPLEEEVARRYDEEGT
jgi:hypothetical protein